MKRPASYNTKQREAILYYIASVSGSHVTATQIAEHFANQDVSVGRTTVYRHLDKLVKSGKVRKYNIDNVSGACFQYVDNAESCQTHLHLKCENCGRLFHLNCEMLNEIQRHFLNQHSFHINAMKTVFYGKCEICFNTL